MASRILRLRIERYRGIESLTWYPDTGVNIILGGGNVGKTTILNAVSLLLNPTNMYPLSDAEYWRRDVEAEFQIEAVISLPDFAEINQQYKMNWPWSWDGENPVLPMEPDAENGDQEAPEIPVYVLRVRGTSDLELEYEIVQPDGNIDRLSVGLRRAIGLVWLAGDDRNDRDLRLVKGSGLDRLLADKGLRGRLVQQFAADDVRNRISDEAETALAALDVNFEERALPTNLGLGVTGGPGLSLNALIGLTADKDGIKLPLSSWGSGTRRLAALTIADALQGEAPITVVDEFERGLEPYRQRRLMEALINGDTQVFVTTHSAAVLSAAASTSLWFLDAQGNLGRLPNNKIAAHQRSDPDTFLARLSVICEGATEVGFMSSILEKGIGETLLDHGVWITDAGGHDTSLDLLEALVAGGLSFAGVVDNEGRRAGRWEQIKDVLGDLLLQWPDGCLEEHIIPMFETVQLEAFIEDPEGARTGMRLRSLAERLGINDADIETIKETAGDGLHQLIIEAATGQVPEEHAEAERSARNSYKGHAKVWFKSSEGGRELAEKVFVLGAWQHLQPEVLPFVNAIRQIIGLPEIDEII